MGRKSQLKNLGRNLKTRIKFSPVGKVFEAGKLQGEALRAYRKMKPLMEHVDDDNCPHCTPLFQVIKDCEYIKALPNGSFKEANAHILSGQCPKCSMALLNIMKCPVYKEKTK